MNSRIRSSTRQCPAGGYESARTLSRLAFDPLEVALVLDDERERRLDEGGVEPVGVQQHQARAQSSVSLIDGGFFSSSPRMRSTAPPPAGERPRPSGTRIRTMPAPAPGPGSRCAGAGSGA